MEFFGAPEGSRSTHQKICVRVEYFKKTYRSWSFRTRNGGCERSSLNGKIRCHIKRQFDKILDFVIFLETDLFSIKLGAQPN